jgi:hypothetical protein
MNMEDETFWVRTRVDWDQFKSRTARYRPVRGWKERHERLTNPERDFRFRSKTLYLPTNARGVFGGQDLLNTSW